MPLTKPAVIVATAVAVSPAKARPIESDINTATVISQPGTCITGKLPAFLGYRIPFGDCNGMKNRISCVQIGLGFKTWVPRPHAAGIRNLPTPTPWGRSGCGKGIPLGAGRRVKMDLAYHSRGHHRPDSLSYPSWLAFSGLGLSAPPRNGQICRRMKRLRRAAKGRTTPISGRREVSAPRNHETGLTSAVLLSLGGVLTVIPRNSQDPQLLASHCGRPVH